MERGSNANRELLGNGEELRTYVEDWFNGLDENEKDTFKISAEFGKILADRVGDGKVPMGYVMATELLIYDCQTGKDGSTGESMPRAVSGYPPVMYTLIRIQAKDFARGAYGDQYGNEVDQVYDEMA
jgi:hypothetical protein